LAAVNLSSVYRRTSIQLRNLYAMLIRFFRSGPAAGIVLFVAALLAIFVANSPLNHFYVESLHRHVAGLSIKHWINDGLMAIFFLQVGLEIKREALEGELSTWHSRILPGIAALGGMIVPALIFAAINLGLTDQLRGWAIPSATDIAFAIGVLTLLGSRIPSALRLLLVSIAIMDDLGAILIIALFYTSSLDPRWLAAAAILWVGCFTLNRVGIVALAPYLALGVLLWICVYNSGIHATLAGVAVALTIPSQVRGFSPIQSLEVRLDRWVSFAILPIFGFANAGIAFSGVTTDMELGRLSLGIVLGLFLGKQIGVMTAFWLAIRTGVARQPVGVDWRQLYGLALLCGIGFTMSLFIGGLAFSAHPHLMDATKIGVLAGSVCSAIAGAIVLRRTVSRPVPEELPIR
jgi:NhaA family Na+:H+ antiporter